MVNNKITAKELLGGVGAGLCLLNKDFRVLWINKTQAEWMGAPSQICGRHCYEAFERRPHICPGCPTRRVFKLGTVQVGARRIAYTKTGEKRYYQLTVSPIRDHRGKVAYALELVQDITDRLIQEKKKAKIIQKVKRLYKHFALVNTRLQHNLQKIKNIINKIRKTNVALRDRYLRKNRQAKIMKKELQDIFKVNLVLSSTVDSRKIASLITKFTCELMHTDACVLRLLNNSKDSLIAISSCGFTNGVIKRSHILKVNQSLSGITVKTRKPIVADDIRKESQIPESFRDSLLKEGFRSRLTVPVVFQKEVLGTITTYSKKPRHFIEEETEILSIFASQVAVAIQESKHYDDIHVNYFNTIHALALALEARDLYTRGHTERVTRYSLRLGKALQMSPEELEILRYAAEVHDIGKVSIPDFILNKPGRLTPAERAIVELHPVKGAEVLEPLEFLKPAIPIVRHHHERYDGTGYPDGLSKDRIPVMSKILACADAFDAMTSERPYRRRKLTMEEALEEIRNNSGSQFDPQVSRLFVRMIQDKLPA